MNPDINTYILQYEPHIQQVLRKVEAMVHELAKDSEEKISWGMPTYKTSEGFFHFSANKHHLGIYPGPLAIQKFAPEFDHLGLKHQKGSLQCPCNKDIPYDRIRRIAVYCLCPKDAYSQ